MSGRAQKRGKSKPFWPCFLRLPVVSISRYVLYFSLSYCKTGKKTFQLVLHCKTSCKAMLCTLTPTFKPVLQQIKFLQVVWILTFDWIKLCECHTIHGIYVNCCNTSLLWSRKHTTCTADFVAKRSCPYYHIFTEDLWYYTMVWFHIFSHIVSRCIINEKYPKIS